MRKVMNDLSNYVQLRTYLSEDYLVYTLTGETNIPMTISANSNSCIRNTYIIFDYHILLLINEVELMIRRIFAKCGSHREKCFV